MIYIKLTRCSLLTLSRKISRLRSLNLSKIKLRSWLQTTRKCVLSYSIVKVTKKNSRNESNLIKSLLNSHQK